MDEELLGLIALFVLMGVLIVGMLIRNRNEPTSMTALERWTKDDEAKSGLLYRPPVIDEIYTSPAYDDIPGNVWYDDFAHDKTDSIIH